MLEAYFRCNADQSELIRDIELAAFGGWCVLGWLNPGATSAESFTLFPWGRGTPIPNGMIVLATAEDRGPLTKLEALAAKALLERFTIWRAK